MMITDIDTCFIGKHDSWYRFFQIIYTKIISDVKTLSKSTLYMQFSWYLHNHLNYLRRLI